MPRRYEEWEISLRLTAITQAVIAWCLWIPTEGPAWNGVPWVVPCPRLGVRCYLDVTYAGSCGYIPPRCVWLSLPWTLWPCREETTWISVRRSNGKTTLGSGRCPEVEWAPEEGSAGAQSHWNLLCWPPAGKLQMNPKLVSRCDDPRTLENDFASKNIQGIESVTVPPPKKQARIKWTLVNIKVSDQQLGSSGCSWTLSNLATPMGLLFSCLFSKMEIIILEPPYLPLNGEVRIRWNNNFQRVFTSIKDSIHKEGRTIHWSLVRAGLPHIKPYLISPTPFLGVVEFTTVQMRKLRIGEVSKPKGDVTGGRGS